MLTIEAKGQSKGLGFELDGGVTNITNSNIENIKECLIEILPQVFSNERKMVKTSHTTLAFAMGGSDYRKFIKEKTK